MTVQTRDVELTPTQKDMLRDLKQQKVLQIENRILAMPNEAVIRGKALQIVMGAVYDDDHKSFLTEAKHRIAELRAVITEATAKVVVFVPFTSVIDMLYDEFHTHEEVKDERGRWGCIVINGSVPRSARDRAVSAFRDRREIRVALCDPGAVAFGFNEFVAATTVVWFGPTDKPELYTQGNARAHRPGQKFPVTIIHLAATALERQIFDRLINKLNLQGVMLDWIKDEKLL